MKKFLIVLMAVLAVFAMLVSCTPAGGGSTTSSAASSDASSDSSSDASSSEAAVEGNNLTTVTSPLDITWGADATSDYAGTNGLTAHTFNYDTDGDGDASNDTGNVQIPMIVIADGIYATKYPVDVSDDDDTWSFLVADVGTWSTKYTLDGDVSGDMLGAVQTGVKEAYQLGPIGGDTNVISAAGASSWNIIVNAVSLEMVIEEAVSDWDGNEVTDKDSAVVDTYSSDMDICVRGGFSDAGWAGTADNTISNIGSYAFEGDITAIADGAIFKFGAFGGDWAAEVADSGDVGRPAGSGTVDADTYFEVSEIYGMGTDISATTDFATGSDYGFYLNLTLNLCSYTAK